MKKILTISLVVLAGFAFTLGFIMEDPNGSKSPATNQGIYVSGVNTSYGTPVYTDNFDALNDTTALKARGYKVYYRGTGPQGSTATWFQGNSTVFAAFNGPATGYVAANYNVVTGTNNIDSWLVLPRLAGGILAGDSLYFYSRSSTGSTWPDSVRVMYSANDSIPEGTWTELGRFRTNTTTGWEKRGFRAPAASVNGRFAIRYCVVNGGPGGSNSDYMGVDALTIERSAAPPTTCSKIAGTWCGLSTYPSMPGATYFNASAWIGDTLYVQAPTSAGAGATTMYKYTYNGAWSTGVPCPVGVVGASMTAAGGKLYLIGGGLTSVTTGTTNVQEYNPATGSWSTKAPLPVPLAAHGSVCWGDSVIFVVGGPYTGAATNLDVHYYRVASNTWGTISASLPAGQGRRTFALSLADGNKIIMSCGFNTAYLKSTYVGTINSATSITWAAAPDAPTSLSRPGGTAYGKFGFVVGGDTNGTAGKNSKVFVFSTQTNTWLAPILNNPNPVSNMMNAVTVKCINDTARIFQPGGYTTVGTANLVVTGCGPVLVGSSNNTTVVPQEFLLSQNYPNPFNPTTKINYSMPKQALVTIKVYDMLGKEVATLVNEVKTAGNYTVEFNGANLSSGVYFYKISAGDFSSVKRMTLIK